jgi:hypothetical protein
MDGNSEKTLLQKLGIKPPMRVCFRGAPRGYIRTLGVIPDEVEVKEAGKDFDLIQFFPRSQQELLMNLTTLKKRLKLNGCLWVCWQKKAAKTSTDLTESIIREFALKNGLVDVKVITINTVWSGLKLVVPMRPRDF